MALALMSCRDDGNDAQHDRSLNRDIADAAVVDSRVRGDATGVVLHTSFTIRAQLTRMERNAVEPPYYWASFPDIHEFTLVVDESAGHVTVGCAGTGAVAPLTRRGAGFLAAAPLQVELVFPSSCGRSAAVKYEELTFTVDPNGALHGTSRGKASIQLGDVISSADITATLEGEADQTAPFLDLAVTKDSLAHPLQATFLGASEPLAADATAAIVTEGAPAIALAPELIDSSRFIRGFSRDDRVLAFNTLYRFVLEGVVDSVGLRAAPVATTFTTEPAPELIAEDGFESASATVGGAPVVGGNGLPAITGSKSVFLTSTAGRLPVTTFSSRFIARLLIKPTDTV